MKKSSRKHKEKLVRENKKVEGPSGAQHFTPGGLGASESRRVSYQRPCATPPRTQAPSFTSAKTLRTRSPAPERNAAVYCLVAESCLTL